MPLVSRRRRLLLGLLYLCLLTGGWLAGDWLAGWAVVDLRPSNEPLIHRFVMLSTGVYVAASALPFVPGAEIGLALILAFGARIAVLVYAAMVAALLLAFLAGRFVPPAACAALFAFLGLNRARDLVLTMAPLDARGRLEFLIARAPTRAVPFLLRHRYLAIAVLFNLPGNTLVGGGGGIALAAGMSGLFALLPYALTVALAVAPVPLVVLVTGYMPGG